MLFAYERHVQRPTKEGSTIVVGFPLNYNSSQVKLECDFEGTIQESEDLVSRWRDNQKPEALVQRLY